MGSKSNPGKFDCYANAHPDEQMFVLLGRDPTGGSLTRLWAAVREQLGEDPAKVAEALSCAAAMDAWCRQVGKAPADVLDLLPFELLAQAIRRRKGVVMVQVREQDGDKLVLPHAPLVPTIVLQGHQVAKLYNLEGGRTGIEVSIGFGDGPRGHGMYAWIGSDASRAIPLFEPLEPEPQGLDLSSDAPLPRACEPKGNGDACEACQ